MQSHAVRTRDRRGILASCLQCIRTGNRGRVDAHTVSNDVRRVARMKCGLAKTIQFCDVVAIGNVARQIICPADDLGPRLGGDRGAPSAVEHCTCRIILKENGFIDHAERKLGVRRGLRACVGGIDVRILLQGLLDGPPVAGDIAQFKVNLAIELAVIGVRTQSQEHIVRIIEPVLFVQHPCDTKARTVFSEVGATERE